MMHMLVGLFFPAACFKEPRLRAGEIKMEFAFESRHKGRGRERERGMGEKENERWVGVDTVQMVGGSFLYFSRFWGIFSVQSEATLPRSHAGI